MTCFIHPIPTNQNKLCLLSCTIKKSGKSSHLEYLEPANVEFLLEKLLK